MQLLGAPKLNDFQAPYCAFQTPMEAAFQRDDEIETYVKTRNGTLSRVGDQALRGRFRLGWDGLDYDTAARILFELKSGEVVLTPRTATDLIPVSARVAVLWSTAVGLL